MFSEQPSPDELRANYAAITDELHDMQSMWKTHQASYGKAAKISPILVKHFYNLIDDAEEIQATAQFWGIPLIVEKSEENDGPASD